jgi:hypothetical protein
MAKVKVATKKRGGSTKSRVGGGKSIDSCRFEAQRRVELETPSENTATINLPKSRYLFTISFFIVVYFIANPLFLRRKKPTAKEPPSKRAKPSPAAIPQTPDAPIPSPARNDIYMEDAAGQFGSMPEANPTTEAMANDVVQSDKASGSFQGHMADASGGEGQLILEAEIA